MNSDFLLLTSNLIQGVADALFMPYVVAVLLGGTFVAAQQPPPAAGDQQPGRKWSEEQLKQFSGAHQLACPSETEIYAAETANWRVQKLTLRP